MKTLRLRLISSGETETEIESQIEALGSRHRQPEASQPTSQPASQTSKARTQRADNAGQHVTTKRDLGTFNTPRGLPLHFGRLLHVAFSVGSACQRQGLLWLIGFSGGSRYTQTHRHTHARTRTHARTHAHTHTHARTHTHTHTHKHTHTHTHTHKHTHTHTHTHTIIDIERPSNREESHIRARIQFMQSHISDSLILHTRKDFK